jgi:hypothetical protein
MTAHLTVCKECHKPIDMSKVGSVRVSAHGRDFCSGKCADAWEQSPDNVDAVRRSHEQARDDGLPHDARTVRGKWSP